MKKAGVFLVTSIAAASSFISSSLSHDCLAGSPFDSEVSSENAKATVSGSARGGESKKFAPRFDGLKFIETLVTAHR
ncbi:uncharacterized protein LOC110036228 [Phalaenopsis equestris]|uniref:uncharacterized protein LOC110036228 n=1 Tax=Phalaenopsis equestris TaxID=78828 RepID=UPI0009E587EB|nr:uncharacterized protein LOC110036228 [Phalaenopsis equestris]